MPSVSCSHVSCFSVCPRDTYEVRPTFCDKPGELVGCLYDFEDTGLFMTDGLPCFLSFGCLTQNLGTDKEKQTNYILYKKADVTEDGLKAKGKKAMNGNRKIWGKN